MTQDQQLFLYAFRLGEHLALERDAKRRKQAALGGNPSRVQFTDQEILAEMPVQQWTNHKPRAKDLLDHYYESMEAEREQIPHKLAIGNALDLG